MRQHFCQEAGNTAGPEPCKLFGHAKELSQVHLFSRETPEVSLVFVEQLFKRRQLRGFICAGDDRPKYPRCERRTGTRRSSKPHPRLNGAVRLLVERERQFAASQAVFHVRYVRVVKISSRTGGTPILTICRVC